ncbi:PBSX family phage terminase large subunit [Natronobacterium gregoryi]|uniref:Terminase n=2 Tax=Natronobacterium gregoryi TaxID=44930 RepID=L0AIZ1_NATGS|nr:phage terminase large subunit [Natronobacterium gregoryi]AFZ73030.1 phage terminase large subunit [Natronobacterium gregoryi SP2]ELY70707.1 phage terminase, large subunit, pbsx family protein [Natronobacterium gregoryi SP2]PLK20443.1 terminase [Natronobacterium gregoryi SP2]SFI63160.1 phage terminase, large subunit, PBSX family [Natronobacterium gregoryi]
MSTTVPQGYQPYESGPITEPTAERFEEEQQDKVLEPLPYQQQFLNYGETYHGIITGIGAGKTTALIQRIGLNIQEWNPGRTGVVITPTVPSLRNVLIPELRKWGWLEIGEWQPSKKRWILPNGSTVIFESADNSRKIQRLRGPNIAWFGMDEPSSIAADAWDIMVGRLREGDYINAFVSGTPKGYNWVYDTFVDPDERLESVNLVHDVTTQDNPHLPDVYTDQIVEQYEGRFYEQEVKGQFTDFEGLVYPWFGEDHLVDGPPEQYDEVVYGVDWGHNNPAVVLAIVREGDRWTIADEWYERRCTTGDQAKAAEEFIDKYGQGTIYCDPSEPSNIHEFERDYGLPAEGAENAVSPGIRKIAEKQDDLRVARHCQNVRNEFSQYQYKDDGDSDDPLKQNDHAMDALRYAIYSHERAGSDITDLGWGS